MSKPKQKLRGRQQHRAKPHGRPRLFIAITVVLMVGVVAAVMFLQRANVGFDTPSVE